MQSALGNQLSVSDSDSGRGEQRDKEISDSDTGGGEQQDSGGARQDKEISDTGGEHQQDAGCESSNPTETQRVT